MKRTVLRVLYVFLMLVFIGIFAVSAFQVFSYEKRSGEEAAQIDDIRSLIVSGTVSGSTGSDANEQNSELVGVVTPDPNSVVIPDGPVVTCPPEESGSYEPWIPSEPPQLLRRTDPGISPEQKYRKLFQANSDFVGWITIPGTNIDYPVMLSPNEPQKYLHLNFYGQYAYCGLPFADHKCSVSPDSDNISIYAHHMKDGSMFMNLAYYESQSYFWTHSTVYFDTMWKYGTYQIFAVVKTIGAGDNAWHFNSYVDLSNPDVFDEYVGYAISHSLYATGVTPQYGDKILTLSTCEYSQDDGRLVVLARRVE